MTLLALIRHGPTAWNRAGRMQGRSDQPLDADGRRRVAAWRVPVELASFAWVTSPLCRAVETAMLLTGEPVAIEPLLAEMAWGDWEGATLAALSAADPAGFAQATAQGLDFRPPGGESPRDVQHRLGPWLRAVGQGGTPTAAVTHKSVIRAVLGLATDWNFLTRPPVRLDWTSAHLFAVDRDGRPTLCRANLSLERAP